MERTKEPTRSVAFWAAHQIGLFVWLLLNLVVVGVVRAIVKRQFSWPGFIATLLTSGVGLVVVFGIVFAGTAPLRGPRELLLWGGAMLVMAVGAALGAVVGRRVGVWEAYLAWVVMVVLLGVHLAKGWNVILDVGPGNTEVVWDLMSGASPGERILGVMWDRVFALGAGGGLLMAILGGSLAYLVFGEEGRFDAGLRFEWQVARQHLAGRHGIVSVTAVVAVLGVALGVGALVAVTAVMSGYQNDVTEKILSTNAHLVVQKYGIDFTEYDEVAANARSVSEVVASTPFSFNEAMLSDGDLGMGVLLKGIVPETAGKVTAVEENLCRRLSVDDVCPERYGEAAEAHAALAAMLEPVDGVPSAIVGAELFRKLKRPVGSKISLTTPIGLAGARGNAPRRMEFRIGGAFRSGMHEFDSRLIYLRLDAAQHLMGLGEAVSGVEFRVTNPEEVEVIGKRVLTAVGRYPYRTLDWRELNLGIFTALKLQKIVMFLVLCAIIVVGAFNIASTLFMAVVEKSREIGVLKSIGARNASIMKIFVLEGWTVGAVGTVLGVILGLAVCGLLSELDLDIAADVYMVGSLAVRVNPVEVLGTVLAALGISHLATIYPALKAARQAPVDAMRYD